ncbi:antitermination protein [Enterobacter hormaechei]|uniref:antitermination protein n=1 Tax=Enterobacter hormaechei TaxID=158836 RepID=UPI00123A855E|nr:antitermination protein [Enterobacter hormaechei]MBU5666986.1 antitermination protein [Enterobacteriaceae bacterium S32_ASV_15]MCE1442381.1 antitermination protein [Enterobacter hormaechei]MCM7444555.1 antitermination protein [Enterobacter hormaechei]MDG0830871.1 antitermination protein [Enterobacter hormaechei]MDG0851909.1 antitermination protein [Enterobacter hormaechei]
MNLENTVKYHFAKSTMISDSPRATASDALTGTDVMAAMGMTQERAAMGYSAFLGKMGISQNDRDRAIALLAEYALSKCDKVAALRKLEAGVKPLVMRQLAAFAFEDYSRSAASVKACDCCAGQGFIEADVFTNKYRRPEGKMTVAGMVKVKETVKVLCKKCNGAGTISAACSDCHGRGKAVNQDLTEKQGVPVLADCKRCGGRGYERIPSTEAYAAVCLITDAISVATWEKSVKRFYDQLITKFDIEEAWAESQLRAITR